MRFGSFWHMSERTCVLYNLHNLQYGKRDLEYVTILLGIHAVSAMILCLIVVALILSSEYACLFGHIAFFRRYIPKGVNPVWRVDRAVLITH